MADEELYSPVSKFKLGNCLYRYADSVTLEEIQQNYVPKVYTPAAGYKGLSTNDFDDNAKTKLNGIEAGAQVNPTIDAALDTTSTNPVRNSVITARINEVDAKIDQRTGYATTATAGIFKVGNNLVMNDGILSATSAYNLPMASKSSDPNPVLGGVKIGNGIDIDQNGIIALKQATTSTLGGVKINSQGGISISNTGEISADDQSLEQLTDTELTSPTNNQILKYNGTKWINSEIPVATDSFIGGIKIGDTLKIDNGVTDIQYYENVIFTITATLESGSYITSSDKYKLLENIIDKQDDTYDYSSCLFIPKTLYLDSIKDDSDNDLNTEDWICNLKECYEEVISDETKLNVNINLYNFNFSGSENVATLEFKVSGTCIGTRETIS